MLCVGEREVQKDGAFQCTGFLQATTYRATDEFPKRGSPTGRLDFFVGRLSDIVISRRYDGAFYYLKLKIIL